MPAHESAEALRPAPLFPGRWVEQAACGQSEQPDAFFLDLPEVALDDVVQICAGCPVRMACLDYALRAGERYGIWGGLTPDERAALLEARASDEGRVA